jgi:hypothetical protein
MVIIQVTTNVEDTKLSTLKRDLITMRSVIELYYHEHEGTYPGRNDTKGKATSDAKTAQEAFEQQLTRYTARVGKVSKTKDGTHKFGPYLMGLPTNPFNGDSQVKCDTKSEKLTERKSGGKEGWQFYTKTGVFLPNDGDHDLY